MGFLSRIEGVGGCRDGYDGVWSFPNIFPAASMWYETRHCYPRGDLTLDLTCVLFHEGNHP